ncbi:trypsinogen-like protein 3 [Gouania willdenowi]|uniref:Trypsinogen-like protein 3 n=1 Tax=Gouania willdenowi TaxID=441366 RepID=A0A8C5ENX1_GOUWI|nr:trypsinogen-like protein 3 [Gouania willdenowi]
MKILLLGLVTLGLAGAAPLEDNKECEPHSRPWQVFLNGKSCSGALIDEWWIVTSFDCRPSPYSIIASLGEHDITVEEGTEQHIRIAEVIVHSPYRSPLHSLVLIRLSEPARFNRYVQPISLPHRCARPGEACTVSGWGSTLPDIYGPTARLKAIKVSIVDRETCEKTLPPYIYWGVMVCAGQANTDNCLQDSASVMECDGQLQGVRWFGVGCNNPAHPTVYSRMCEYNEWIYNVMDQYRPTVPAKTK